MNQDTSSSNAAETLSLSGQPRRLAVAVAQMRDPRVGISAAPIVSLRGTAAENHAISLGSTLRSQGAGSPDLHLAAQVAEAREMGVPVNREMLREAKRRAKRKK